MQSLKVHKIRYENDGKTIHYDYTVSRAIARYFDKDNTFFVGFEQDVSDTPLSLAIIPLLANVMPMAWLVGFDVYVDTLDETFHKSLNILKEQFALFHPDKNITGDIHYNTLVKNTINGNGTAQLFSGGLDSWDTYTRNHDKDPFLISVHGADVPIGDTETWRKFKRFNSEEEILNHDKLFYVEANLRDFYTYELDLIAKLAWWGHVQHGMALLGVLAPLSFQFGFKNINIAASATHEISYSWGSSPKIDENMRWADTQVVHEGYEYDRTQKVDHVVAFAKKENIPLKIRVCYADERDGYNCNWCHKCQRTILSLILSGANPAEYGFKVPGKLYEIILKNFNDETVMTEGIKYQWRCLQEKAKKKEPFFVLEDEQKEREAIARFASLNLDEIVNKNEHRVQRKKEMKFKLRKRFPFLYSIYQKIKI